jgi:hypothetical protein
MQYENFKCAPILCALYHIRMIIRSRDVISLNRDLDLTQPVLVICDRKITLMYVRIFTEHVFLGSVDMAVRTQSVAKLAYIYKPCCWHVGLSKTNVHIAVSG